MYTENSIEDIRNADITQIIGNYAELKRAGANFTCCSPFSEEKTPSFMVNPTKNNWVCYSTQQAGDGIKFVMLYNRCDFLEAVKTIAGICNITLLEENVSPEQQKKRKERGDMFSFMQACTNQYQKQLQNLPPDHWVKEMIAEREINQETLLSFAIGYAPDNAKFITTMAIDKGVFDFAKRSGVSKVKEGRSYDFFRNKLMFPIHDVNGNVVAYGGRRANDADGPKYINSAESEIYAKSKTLYGLYQAKHIIAKTKTAILTEGYTDVTAMHQNGCPNAIASCGTALTDEQCKLLRRFAAHVILCRDNDGYDEKGNVKAGLKAALRDIDTLLRNGFRVSVVVFPEGEDPDSLARRINAKDTGVLSTKHNIAKDFDSMSHYIEFNIMDAVKWKAEFLKIQAANDPYAISEATDAVAQMLFQIKDDVSQAHYLAETYKILKVTKKQLKDRVEAIYTETLEKASKQKNFDEDAAENLGLPKGADIDEFMKFRFCTIGQVCWFQGRNGFFKGTNFRIEPLFHVYGKDDNKRLCEIQNEHGEKRLIDFDSSDFVSQAKFEERLIEEGFFVLLENFSKKEFTLIKNRALSDFVMAYELKTLGWQNEGFLAFANAVYANGVTKFVNKYGIVQLEKVDNGGNEYVNDVKHYYSPAFSEIYKSSRDDDDPYENDRYFELKQSPIDLNTWMRQLQRVYGPKAITGIACVFFSCFRDLFVHTHAVSPVFFLTGEKGSGKTKFADSLAAIFSYKQPAFDLNGSTLPGFSRRIARVRNVMQIMEEFHDNIDTKILQSIKGSYDNRGREVGKATTDNRTKVAKVNCFLTILSQYLSSWDDNSITIRSVIEHVIKQPFTQEDIEEYNKLKSWEEAGLNSLMISIVQHREAVKEKYKEEYANIIRALQKELKGFEYEERMLQNYVVLLVPLKILWQHFTFPFTWETMYNQFKDAIIDSSGLIVESEGLAEFWRILEYLLDRQPYPLLKSGYHFLIDKPTAVKLQQKKGEADNTWPNQFNKNLLFLRLNAVHQLYHKEVSTREGVEVITENTLRNYFKSKKYFIGSVKSHRFDDTSTSAYVFDYDMMYEKGVLNLSRDVKDPFEKTEETSEAPTATTATKKNKDEDDLPF